MKNIKKLYLFVILLIAAKMYSQIGIGTASPHSSAILDISNSSNKAFLPPRVTLTQLSSSTTPVSNPAEGLIVYNSGGTQLEGYYIWNNGIWSLMATSANTVSNMVIENTNSAVMLAGLANSTFQGLSGGNIILNTITGVSYNPATGAISLPAGKYSVTVALNISVPDENPANGLGVSIKSHTHYYEAKLTNTAGTVSYSAVVLDNATSNTSGDKKHTANFTFSVNLAAATDVVFRLAHKKGGTYENGVGGVSPNNGRITLNHTIIHIQKSL